jgi:MFS family permease
MAPFYPLAMALLAELFPQKISSTVSFAISMQSAFVILMNLLIGILSDRFGIETAMYSSIFFGGLSWMFLMRL